MRVFSSETRTEIAKVTAATQATISQQVHVATLTDLCHPATSELEQKSQERSARAVRCDVAKDDSCSYVVSTEQVSLSLTNDGRDCSLTLVSGNLDAQDKQATMSQLTPKSKWRTFPHCCNCSKSEGEAGNLSQMATGWKPACA